MVVMPRKDGVVVPTPVQLSTAMTELLCAAREAHPFWGARKLLAANSAHIGLRFAGMAAHASGRAGDPAAAPCRQSPPRRHTPRNILTLAQVDSRSSLMTSRKSDKRVLLAIV